MFAVPGEKPAPYDMQNVAHGTVHVNWYESKTLNVWRRIDVYTPPGYETAKALTPCCTCCTAPAIPKPGG